MAVPSSEHYSYGNRYSITTLSIALLSLLGFSYIIQEYGRR